MTFGVNLKKWRKAAGMTQPELAEAVDVNVSYISNLERNFSANKSGKPQPSRALCKRLARVLGINESEVMLAAGYAPDSSVESFEIMDGVKVNFEEGNKLTKAQREKILEIMRITAAGVKNELSQDN